MRHIHAPATAALITQVFGTSEAELVEGSDGRDVLAGLAGNDTLGAGDGNDLLLGGAGRDMLDGDAGDDLMLGGAGGDVYTISTLDGGTDVIVEAAPAPIRHDTDAFRVDEVQLTGFASNDAAIHSIAVELDGDDMILSLTNAAEGTSGQVIIDEQFGRDQPAIETLDFGFGTDYSVALLTGDQHLAADGDGAEDLVVGTEGDDEVYGGLGDDLLVGGAGADEFEFRAEASGHDLVLDFDTAADLLDYADIDGLDMTGVTIADNVWGNAEVTTEYGTVELDGVTAAELTADMFLFA